jgi:hypothetical protein
MKTVRFKNTCCIIQILCYIYKGGEGTSGRNLASIDEEL